MVENGGGGERGDDRAGPAAIELRAVGDEAQRAHQRPDHRARDRSDRKGDPDKEQFSGDIE
jgi:hypothetical protein